MSPLVLLVPCLWINDEERITEGSLPCDMNVIKESISDQRKPVLKG